MKIGIITFHRADNYGAVLQCYALQESLQERIAVQDGEVLVGESGIQAGENWEQGKIEVQVVDYRNNELENGYRIFPRKNANFRLRRCVKIAVKRILKFYRLPKLMLRRKRFIGFRKEYLHLSPQFTDKSVGEIDKCFALLIVGSDQVWNTAISRKKLVYALDFQSETRNHAVKCSYAASFGSIASMEDIYFAKVLSSFSCISVREADAQAALSRLLKREVALSLDPTLLLRKEAWEALAGQSHMKLPAKYIFLYLVEPKEELYRMASFVKEKLGLPVFCIDYREQDWKGFHYVRHAGPEDFLKLIQRAEVILTSSFHASVFSAVFEKELYMMSHTVTGSRVRTLAEIFGIEERLCADYEDFVRKYERREPICYQQESYEYRREQSLEYITRMLEKLVGNR